MGVASVSDAVAEAVTASGAVPFVDESLSVTLGGLSTTLTWAVAVELRPAVSVTVIFTVYVAAAV
jgi:hypothetical protein